MLNSVKLLISCLFIRLTFSSLAVNMQTDAVFIKGREGNSGTPVLIQHASLLMLHLPTSMVTSKSLCGENDFLFNQLKRKYLGALMLSFGCKRNGSVSQSTIPALTTTGLKNISTAGTSSGSFTTNLTGLDINSVYYIRSYATKSVGAGYGNVVTLNTANDTSKVRFTYNGKEVTYGIIISPTTGKKWLDRNLGALQVAASFDDYKAYGDLFQWGRPADGHQLITWTSSTIGNAVNGMTTVLATSDVPGHSDLITSASPYTDWRSDNNRNRWATLPQGPCPAGWHVPTQSEWAAEINKIPEGEGTATTGGMTDLNTAYSQLKLTIAGYRLGSTYPGYPVGTLRRAGTFGYYWSADDIIDGTTYPTGVVTTFGANFVDFQSLNKSWGGCVRCIMN